MGNIGIYEWAVVLIGMGTVFIALIVLWWILEGFSLISSKFKNLNTSNNLHNSPTDIASSKVNSEISKDVVPEKVAAIMAAISVTHSQARKIEIASPINSQAGMKGFQTPMWGYVNRFSTPSITLKIVRR